VGGISNCGTIIEMKRDKYENTDDIYDEADDEEGEDCEEEPGGVIDEIHIETMSHLE
jgi:hypothetical protein